MSLLKMQLVQQLEDSSDTSPTEFGNWCLQSIELDAQFSITVIYSSECDFAVDEKLNKHSFWLCGTENPQVRSERVLMKK